MRPDAGVDELEGLLDFLGHWRGRGYVGALCPEALLVSGVCHCDERTIGGRVAVRTVLHQGLRILVTHILQESFLLGDDIVAGLPTTERKNCIKLKRKERIPRLHKQLSPELHQNGEQY